MLKVISKIPSYYLFRTVGWPCLLPMNLTISPSFKCNSRCKTCNIYKKDCEELSLEEWEKVLHGLGKSPFWFTISGGEPFLKRGLFDFVRLVYDICRPSIINIPTNGLLFDRIPKVVKRIATYCKKTEIVVNVSIDGIEEADDDIRGIPGSYHKAVATFKDLKGLSLPNLSVGIHTVISRFNVDNVPQISQKLRALKPDSYITEIAEERVELDTIGAGISPEYSRYSKAADYLVDQLKQERFSRMGRITRAFRIEYYKMVKRVLQEQRQIIPCYAGFASAQIAPDGNVWMCCIKAESIGNLRDRDYRFKDIWFSEKAGELREMIRKGECHCPLANASYTNMLHNAKSLYRVGCNLLGV